MGTNRIMRKLTASQKKILLQYPKCFDIEQLPGGVWDRLEQINDTEVLWQNANRYLHDNYKY